MEEAIFDAVRANRLEEVRSILERDPSQAAAVAALGDQPLHCVDNPEIAELLIRHGADVNAKGYDDMSPLHAAAKGGYSEIVPVLIAHGADVNCRHELGWTPLIYAISCCSEAIINMLLDAGAEYDLYAAVARGDLERVRQIFDQFPNTLTSISPADVKDMLCLGARDVEKKYGGVGNVADRIEIIKTLFEKGVSIEKKEIRNIAERYSNNKELSTFLLRYS